MLHLYPILSGHYIFCLLWQSSGGKYYSGGKEMERIPFILLPLKSMREICGNTFWSSKESQHLGLSAFFLIPVYERSVGVEEGSH